jgi:hypothetical protein
MGIKIFGATGRKNRQREASERADISDETGGAVEVPTASNKGEDIGRE